MHAVNSGQLDTRTGVQTLRWQHRALQVTQSEPRCMLERSRMIVKKSWIK